MPDILVRGLQASTIARLKERAKAHGRSLQSEARIVLENAAGKSLDEVLAAAGEWRKRHGRVFEDSAELIREDRER